MPSEQAQREGAGEKTHWKTEVSYIMTSLLAKDVFPPAKLERMKSMFPMIKDLPNQKLSTFVAHILYDSIVFGRQTYDIEHLINVLRVFPVNNRDEKPTKQLEIVWSKEDEDV